MNKAAEDHRNGGKSIWRHLLVVGSWSVFLAANAIITMTFVIAPYDTGIPDMADTYKMVSQGAGILAAIVIVRLKRTCLLVPLALVQMAAFLAFAKHLNTLF